MTKLVLKCFSCWSSPYEISSSCQSVSSTVSKKRTCKLYKKSLPDTLTLDEPKLSFLEFCLCWDITQNANSNSNSNKIVLFPIPHSFFFVAKADREKTVLESTEPLWTLVSNDKMSSSSCFNFRQANFSSERKFGIYRAGRAHKKIPLVRAQLRTHFSNSVLKITV